MMQGAVVLVGEFVSNHRKKNRYLMQNRGCNPTEHDGQMHLASHRVGCMKLGALMISIAMLFRFALPSFIKKHMNCLVVLVSAFRESFSSFKHLKKPRCLPSFRCGCLC